jgi:hypothetical protein
LSRRSEEKNKKAASGRRTPKARRYPRSPVCWDMLFSFAFEFRVTS